MLKQVKGSWKKKLYRARALLFAKLCKPLMALLIRTCRVQVEGLEHFVNIAKEKKCILMLWHNRLAIIPSILHRYTPKTYYAAVVSGSRDGEILSDIIKSYKYGRLIRVSHQGRYHALREVVRHIEERKEIVVITPDGPRGPRYEMKAGVAIAAIETQAHVIALDWEADRYWELNTWDRLRLPKPFSTISFRFLPSISFENPSQNSLEEAKLRLKQYLPE